MYFYYCVQTTIVLSAFLTLKQTRHMSSQTPLPGRGDDDSKNAPAPPNRQHLSEEPASPQLTGMVITPTGDSDVSLAARLTRLKDDMLKRQEIAVASVSNYGFRLIDNTFLYGPVALFPKLALSWRVLTPDHITEESVAFFGLLEPKLDIVLIGCGDREHVDGVRSRVAPYFHKLGIGLEVMRTEDAVPVFNFLNDEHRYVAAGLYPPDDMKISREQKWRAMEALGGTEQATTLHVSATLGAMGLERRQLDGMRDQLETGRGQLTYPARHDFNIEGEKLKHQKLKQKEILELEKEQRNQQYLTTEERQQLKDQRDKLAKTDEGDNTRKT